MAEEKKDDKGQIDRRDIFSKAVRAGKRTYFLDVKATRKDEYYLTITESKKKFSPDGKSVYEKHKIFLYKEDFDKFAEGLTEAIDKVKELQGTGEFSQESPMDRIGSDDTTNTDSESGFSDVSFDDLGE